MLPWSSNLKDKAAELLQQLDASQASHVALSEVSAERLAQLQHGITRFQQSPYERPESTQPVLWQEGSSRLMDHTAGTESESIMLFVPSLINRAYIFDLSERASMLHFLQQQGIGCMLMDWGDPTEAEQDFGLEDYIARLNRAIARLDKPVVLAGYCMGGMMALAAAQLNPKAVKALALLATPWDFHAEDVPPLPGRELYASAFEEYLKTSTLVPGDLVYQLLYSTNPWPVHDKFMRFAEMEPESHAAQAFIEKEHWVQDGVALTTKVARTCFIEWPVHNTPGKGAWSVAGQVIQPETITAPAFTAIARQDSIVPARCAGALSMKLPGALTIYPPSGHVGMMVGGRAKEYLWLPLAKWFRSL